MRIPASLVAVLLTACAAPAVPLASSGAWDTDNVFAQIQRGEEPAAIVYQDSRVLAIMDHAPITRGHVLVLSKTAHARDLIDVPPADLALMMAVVRRVAVAERDAFGATGSTVMIDNGSMQSVHSLHIHVVPAYNNQPIDFAKRPPIHSQAELEAVAVKLRAALAAQR